MPEVPARWLSPRSACAYLDVSLRTFYAWAADGTIKGIARIARRNSKGVGRHRVTIRCDKFALDKFLEGRAR